MGPNPTGPACWPVVRGIRPCTRQRHAARVGIVPDHSFTRIGASETMVSPRSSGPSRASMKDFCQSPSALPKAGWFAPERRLKQHWMLHQPLLDDHAADRVSDENRLDHAKLIQEILQCVGKRRNTDGRKQGRSTIARHVPGNRRGSGRQSGELTAQPRAAPPIPCRNTSGILAGPPAVS